METYWSLVHHEGQAWGISFPDVPGCVSAGRSLEEVLDEGRDALSAHLALLKAEGDAIPKARSFASLMADPRTIEDAGGATWHRIAPRPVQAPRLRVNVMIEPGLLRLADGAAEAGGKTRSGLIEEALSRWLQEKGSPSPRIDRKQVPRARTKRSA